MSTENLCIDCERRPENPEYGQCDECHKNCGRCGEVIKYRVDSKFGTGICLICWEVEYAGDLGYEDWQETLQDFDNMAAERSQVLHCLELYLTEQDERCIMDAIGILKGD